MPKVVHQSYGSGGGSRPITAQCLGVGVSVRTTLEYPVCYMLSIHADPRLPHALLLLRLHSPCHSTLGTISGDISLHYATRLCDVVLCYLGARVPCFVVPKENLAIFQVLCRGPNSMCVHILSSLAVLVDKDPTRVKTRTLFEWTLGIPQPILPLCLRDLGLEELRALRYWVPDKALVKLRGFLLIPSPFLRENEEGITTVITEIDTFSHENGRSLPSNFAHSNGMRCHYYFVGET